MSIKWVSTLCPEGFPAEVTLVRPLVIVYTQMQVEVVFLRERVAAYVTNKGTLISVEQNTDMVLKKSTIFLSVLKCYVSKDDKNVICS